MTQQFVKQVAVVLAVTAALGTYPLWAYAEAARIWAVVVGCGLCTLNVLAGCFSLVWAFEKPHTVFLKVLFGGMFLRLAGIGLVFIVLIKLTDLDIPGLTGSLLFFYMVFQVLEIRFLVRHLSTRQVPKEGT